MGFPESIWTPKVGVPLVYGVARVHVDPNLGAPLLYGVPRTPMNPPPRKLRVPLLYGGPWTPMNPPKIGGPLCTPKAGGPSLIWGALDPRVPQKSGSLCFMGWPGISWTPNLGPPLLYGVPRTPMNPPPES